MSVNSSKTYNDSLLQLQPSSLNSFLSFELHCFIPKPGCFIFTTFTFINILFLLPLCIFILYYGLQQWRQQRSSSTTMSHSDSFTYHLVTMELIYVFGCIICCCGIYMNYIKMLMVWYYLFSISWYGETFFQLLTCVEHYLAVIHPITYLSLKKERWIRIRNIIIVCIWLLCFGWTSLMAIGNIYLVVDVCLLIISVIIISFCSISVLYVLIRPGPGEQGRDKVKVDQSKQRAFYTTVAILGVLFLRCVWNLVWSVQSVLNGWINECVSIISGVWISLPGSLVLPLLFIHRAGMLSCGRNNMN